MQHLLREVLHFNLERGLLNDTGFSSSSSSQTVVPKYGTVMFVTFIPAKQFEQAWWALPCASRNFTAAVADPNHRELIPLTTKEKTAGKEDVGATGYDVQSALNMCRSVPGREKQWTYNPFPSLKSHASGSFPIQSAPADTPKRDTPPFFLNVSPIHFKNWSGNALAIFQELTTAVVAGVHVVDETSLAPVLTDLSCERDDTGKVKFPADDKGQLACKVTGKNLEAVMNFVPG